LNSVIEESLLLVKHETHPEPYFPEKHLADPLPKSSWTGTRSSSVHQRFINAIHAMGKQRGYVSENFHQPTGGAGDAGRTLAGRTLWWKLKTRQWHTG